jgi:hypothetical protein
MNKKPERFNINKRVGQVNQTRNLNGRLVERTDFLFVMMGEQLTYVQPVYDPDHFIYQNLMPITEDEVRIKYLGVLPKHLRGAHIMCTCGAEAVIALEGDYAGMAVCKSVATLGKHQTSFQIKEGKMVVDKKTQDERYMGDSDIAKTIKSEEQAKDEHSEAIRKGSDLDE